MSSSAKVLTLLLTAAMLAAILGGLQPAAAKGIELSAEAKPATELTALSNKQVYSLLDFNDKQEAEFANRGLIDAPAVLELTNAAGKVVWSQKGYAFLEQDAPDTANPSLWRNARLNHAYGLFEVKPGIYQVRGYDMTNLTLVATESGWIVFDPLMSVECTQAAMQLVKKNLGDRPVKAVIISHPHVDHFGGIRGLIAERDVADAALPLAEQIASGKIPVIVPKHFTEHAIKENIYAGNAMARRAQYQYGTLLEKSAKGALAIGIGMGQSLGTVSFINPSYEVEATGETITIDGVSMEFQMTPGTEAPAEMNTWLPQHKALWMAENCTGTLHNLYTLRGAEVRDGNAWAKYLMESLVRYGDEAQVVFQSHNWPHWGNEVIRPYMENTAAAYKYINDQTLMYLNQGYTANEIARRIALPAALQKVWYTRQYYGTVAHNSKAVYQKYMGWYDANPVNLHPLTPSDKAKKFVEYLGDKERVLRLAKADFAKGEYQWVAEITNLLVFADPNDRAARLLCADALEQLGYQAESGTWRNAYLTGAQELRKGAETDIGKKVGGSQEVVRQMTATMMLDYLGILIDGQAAQNKDLRVNLVLTDTGETYLLHLYHGVLLYYPGKQSSDAAATLTCPRLGLFTLFGKDVATMRKAIRVEGDAGVLAQLTEDIVAFDPFFKIVEP